jgi:hypothetical protein
VTLPAQARLPSPQQRPALVRTLPASDPLHFAVPWGGQRRAAEVLVARGANLESDG